MTSRERILTAISHKESDRVPIDFGSMRSTGIMAIAYNKLKAHLGITTGETRMYDTYQQLAEPEQWVLDRFGVDSVDATNSFGRFPEKWKDWTLPDGSHCKVPSWFGPVREPGRWVIRDENGAELAQMPDGCLYFEGTRNILADAETTDDVDRLFHPGIFSKEGLAYLREQAKWVHENTEYATMIGFGGNILEGGQGLFGWERFMMEVALDSGIVNYALDKMVEGYMENLRLLVEALDGYVNIIQMGDDLGSQTATLLSPDMYRKVVKPRHTREYQFIRNKSSIHVFLHACGSCYDVIGDLIDEGVEILNPVQTSAVGMEPRRLKKQFGDKITFWGGGCDTQSILPNATPQQIDEHVKERIEIFAPGGGFVFNQIHNVQANVPPENVVAMYEAARKYGGRRLIRE